MMHTLLRIGFEPCRSRNARGETAALHPLHASVDFCHPYALNSVVKYGIQIRYLLQDS